MAGKKILKRLVFGDLVKMPAEIGPQINSRKKAQEAQNKSKKKINSRKKAQEAQNKSKKKINGRKKAQKAQKCPHPGGIAFGFHRAGITQNGEDEGTLYRGRYVEPMKIPASKADREHKVIYCVATLK